MRFLQSCVSTAIFLAWFLLVIPSIYADPAEKLMDSEHWKQARAIVTERLKANSSDAQANYLLSKIEESFGNLDTAMALAEKSVALNGQSADYHAQLAEVYGLMAQRASVVKQVLYVRKMRREINEALAINPKHLDALLVEMMFSWKAPSLAGGDRAKALRIVNQLKATNPVWGYLAEARLYQDEDPKKVEAALVKAAQVKPAFYRAQAALANFYCCVTLPHRPADAERVAKTAVSLDPRQVAAYSSLASVYVAEKRFADLDRVLAEARKNVPDDLTPFYQAAKTLMDTGQDFPRAEKYLRTYLASSPEARAPAHVQTRWLLARIFEKQGKFSEAAGELQAVLQLDPYDADARRELKRLH